MGFYFCGRYIHINGDPKEVEWKMSTAVPTFRGFYDCYGYEDLESNLETFFNYFVLTSKQKSLCARVKLVEEHCFKSQPIYRYIGRDTDSLSKTIR